MKFIKNLNLIALSILLTCVYSCTNAQNNSKNSQMTTQKEKEVKLKIETSKGAMTVKLYNETPQHRDNFIKLAKEGYYNGVLFHRVIKEFMIQGGDPDSKNAAPGQRLGEGGPDYTIPAEFNQNLYHKKGALAAARTADQINPQKASSGSQFYIVQGKTFTDDQLDQIANYYQIQFTPQQRNVYRTIGGTPFLDMNYTVFGEVIEGMSVIDMIASVQTDRDNRPVEDVKIISITVVEE